MIKLKDTPLSKCKSILSTMGLLCFCFVGLGCSLKAPKYIIDIDGLTDTDPETSDKRLKAMGSVQLVHEERKREVGYRIASAYESRSKAVYWDGRNGVGERVASGVYFYTLTASDFSATRRMLILK